MKDTYEDKYKHHEGRFVGEVVELTRDCELGGKGMKAVVIAIDGKYMTLVFPEHPVWKREVYTGADYRFLVRV